MRLTGRPCGREAEANGRSWSEQGSRLNCLKRKQATGIVAHKRPADMKEIEGI